MQQAFELREIPIGEQRQVAIDDFQRVGEKRGGERQRLQLQREAFGAIACTHAGRLEALHVLQRDRQLLRLDLQLGGEQLGDFLERRRQVAVFVERVDQRRDDMPVAQRQVQERKLAIQVIAQRARGDLLRKEIVVIGTVAAAPVAIAAAAVIGEVGHFRGVIARSPRIGVVGDRRHLAGIALQFLADASRAGERHFGGAFFLGFRAFEQRIFLQHPLDLGIQFDRR
jgi:hypothetical protein